MPILWRSTLRWPLRRPWQALLAVIGVAMGVAVVIAIDIANDSARRAFVASTQTLSGQATHQIVGGTAGIPEDFFRRLRVDVGVAASAPVVEGYVQTNGATPRTLTVLGIDIFSELAFRPQMTASGTPLGNGMAALLTVPDSVVLSQRTAATLGVAAGDQFTVQIASRTRQLTVVAVLGEGGGSEAVLLDDLLLTDIATAQEWYGKVGVLDRIDLMLADDAAQRAVAALLPPGLHLTTPAQRAQSITQMTESFEINLNALSLLALVVGMFLIYNTMTFSVVQRRQLLGTLRCLGVGQRDIAVLMLVEGTVIGVVGTLVGLGLGVALAQFLLGLVAQTINDLYYVVHVTTINVTTAVLVKGSVLGIAASFVALAIPTYEAAHTPPRTVLRRSSYEEQTQRVVPWLAALGAVGAVGGIAIMAVGTTIWHAYAGLLGLTLGAALVTPWVTVVCMRLLYPLAVRWFGLVAGMAVRDVITSLSRTGVAIAALMIAVAVTIAVGVMVASFRVTVVDWLTATIRADVFVSAPSLAANRLDTPLPAGVAERVAALPGVTRVRQYRSAMLDTERTPVLQIALEVTPADYETFLWAAGDPAEIWPAFARDAIIISEPLARKRNLTVGDTFVLRTSTGDRTVPIAGVFYDYGTELGVVMLPLERYRTWYADDTVTSLGVYVAPGVDPEQLVGTVQALFPDDALLVRSNATLRARSVAVLDRTFAITNVLQLLATIVAFVGILAALTAMQLERTREFGMLRALGLDPGQLWRLIITETCLMGAVAGLVAIPVGTAMAWALVAVINRISFGWTLQLAPQPEIFGQAVVTAVLAALLAGIVPAWRIGRTAPALALREE